ncbi:hypothetical protein SFRURICE_017730 [Spodoptera frugiperda]|uniref:SFRICE_010429 n=1 Tax=Spodoptera frugiperda TaxID=7108 RepID=A0A2H1VXI3_SPOFR|nr:hypothetical protein SFRURICE_017730 [Spodoptera frugiperda]
MSPRVLLVMPAAFSFITATVTVLVACDVLYMICDVRGDESCARVALAADLLSRSLPPPPACCTLIGRALHAHSPCGARAPFSTHSSTSPSSLVSGSK